MDNSYTNLDNEFKGLPEFADGLIHTIQTIVSQIRDLLNTTQEVVDKYKDIRASIQAVIEQFKGSRNASQEQVIDIPKGSWDIMRDQEGHFVGQFRVGEYDGQRVPLQELAITPELSAAIFQLAMYVQLADISRHLNNIQQSLDILRQGLENDRLSTATSCKQKLLQIMRMNNPNNRANALLRLVFDAEDSRNVLMMSQEQIEKIKLIMAQPDSFLGKLFSGDSEEKINSAINDIRINFEAITAVSFIEAMAYCEMDETESALQSLIHYSNYLSDNYISTGLAERLDLMEQRTDNYWSNAIRNVQSIINNRNYSSLLSDSADVRFENIGTSSDENGSNHNEESQDKKCKKCGRILPESYNNDVCENCNNKTAESVGVGLKIVGGVLGGLGLLAGMASSGEDVK